MSKFIVTLYDGSYLSGCVMKVETDKITIRFLWIKKVIYVEKIKSIIVVRNNYKIRIVYSGGNYDDCMEIRRFFGLNILINEFEKLGLPIIEASI
jgi:hypothetical protein